jgi:hypothetical protein
MGGLFQFGGYKMGVKNLKAFLTIIKSKDIYYHGGN